MGSKRHGHVCALLQKLQIMTLNYMTFLKSVNELNKTMALFLSIIVESDIMTIVTSVIISYYIYKERERERMRERDRDPCFPIFQTPRRN